MLLRPVKKGVKCTTETTNKYRCTDIISAVTVKPMPSWPHVRQHQNSQEDRMVPSLVMLCLKYLVERAIVVNESIVGICSTKSKLSKVRL